MLNKFKSGATGVFHLVSEISEESRKWHSIPEKKGQGEILYQHFFLSIVYFLHMLSLFMCVLIFATFFLYHFWTQHQDPTESKMLSRFCFCSAVSEFLLHPLPSWISYPVRFPVSWSVSWTCPAWRTRRPNTCGRWSNVTSTFAKKRRRGSGMSKDLHHKTLHLIKSFWLLLSEKSSAVRRF